MKRFHVHIAVADLAESVRFYSTLFGAEPTLTRDDYAKWMLEDPRINFAISARGAAVGVNHLGFQVDSDAELEALRAQLESADRAVLAEQGSHCCYARSDKYWISDPAGVAWESFHTLGSIPVFGAEEAAAIDTEQKGGCCAPDPAAVAMPKTKCATSRN